MGVSILVPMPEPSALRRIVDARLPRFLAELERLVNIDCGSYTPDGVNRVASIVADALSELGADVERIGHQPARPTRRRSATSSSAAFGVMGPACSSSATWTPSSRPAPPRRVRTGSRVAAPLGPGVTDMKAGLLAGLHAIAALHEAGVRPSVTFVANPDEEIGSPFSTPHIRTLARDHDAALVLECARANGDIVSARKGIADVEITLVGRAAHAGVEPEKGRSAILAAAHQVVGAACAQRTLADGHRERRRHPRRHRGRTSSPSVARSEVDLRAASTDAFDAAAAEVERIAMAPTVEGVHGSLRRIASHPPMERTAASSRMVELAVGIAAELGFPLTDAATGGASDANTTAALGIPTLDGLGPVGGDDHSVDEWLDLESVVPRTTLLALLVARIGDAV